MCVPDGRGPRTPTCMSLSALAHVQKKQRRLQDIDAKAITP